MSNRTGRTIRIDVSGTSHGKNSRLRKNEPVASAKASVVTARNSPRMRSAGMPMSDGDDRAGETGDDEAEDEVVAVLGHRPGDRRAEAGERHLAEADLPGPSRQHGERHRDHGEDQADRR